jgi:putative restriction endonuclease
MKGMKMPVCFRSIKVGAKYSRPQLADIWGYKGYQALARGVVTPRNQSVIILFVTENKQAFQEQYRDKLLDQVLEWEGPTDHFAEERMVQASVSGDEIHIFHREIHHSDFTYLGRATVADVEVHSHCPSIFRFNF